MIYSSNTFPDYYSAFSQLHAYFLPIHRNGEVPVLEIWQEEGACFLFCLVELNHNLCSTNFDSEVLIWETQQLIFTPHKQTKKRSLTCFLFFYEA
jgi:hypothetical protein